MVDGPLNFPREVARPVPYTTALARAMNMQAILHGWLPEVIPWHTTVSDQFMMTADGAIGGGLAAPATMNFAITFDGVWVVQFPLGTYFNPPIGGVYQVGGTQPAPQPVPSGYRAAVTKVDVEVSWVPDPANLYDPGDFARWSWMRRRPEESSFSVVPGTLDRPCYSRTYLGTDNVGAATPSLFTYNQIYHYPEACQPVIFLEPGDRSFLRVRNFTANATQQMAVSVSASGVRWPIGLEAV